MRAPATIVSVGIGLLAVLRAACPSLGDDGQRPAPPLRPSLERIEDAPAESLAVRATVENVSEQPVGFDRKFAAYLSWDVVTDDGMALKSEHVADIERSDEELDKARFVVLMPGETLSADFRLAEQVRVFESGHGAFPDGDVPTGYEVVRRYPLPKDAAPPT